MGVDGGRSPSCGPGAHNGDSKVILLDTNALLWLDVGHRRAGPLSRWGGRLHASPASLLEIQFLLEVGRVRLRNGTTIEHLAADVRWTLDDPPSVPWFDEARGVTWTRDPFDRLLVAHARHRNWRLATGDGHLLERLADTETIEL